MPRGFAPEDALNDQIRDLEAWASSILRRNRGRTQRFWVSRGVAFVTAAAASAGVMVKNASSTEPLVMLKHFGPGNPDLKL